MNVHLLFLNVLWSVLCIHYYQYVMNLSPIQLSKFVQTRKSAGYWNEIRTAKNSKIYLASSTASSVNIIVPSLFSILLLWSYFFTSFLSRYFSRLEHCCAHPVCNLYSVCNIFLWLHSIHNWQLSNNMIEGQKFCKEKKKKRSIIEISDFFSLLPVLKKELWAS